MLLNIDNPVYNTIVVFLVIILIIYIIKPNVVYDKKKNEFRQFGMTGGKTLLPIYVVGILLAIILYVFFYYISIKNKEVSEENIHKESMTRSANKTGTEHHNFQQQIQIQNIQNQINQLVQQQMTSQLMNQQILQSHIPNKSSNSILPNSLNV